MVGLVVWDQLQAHCSSHNILHSNHHGSTPNHDCITVLGQLQDVATSAAEVRRLTAIIRLDQTAEYDLVDHPILLRKMEALNFRHSTVAWFRSYLSGRWVSVPSSKS